MDALIPPARAGPARRGANTSLSSCFLSGFVKEGGFTHLPSDIQWKQRGNPLNQTPFPFFLIHSSVENFKEISRRSSSKRFQDLPRILSSPFKTILKAPTKLWGSFLSFPLPFNLTFPFATIPPPSLLHHFSLCKGELLECLLSSSCITPFSLPLHVSLPFRARSSSDCFNTAVLIPLPPLQREFVTGSLRFAASENVVKS